MQAEKVTPMLTTAMNLALRWHDECQKAVIFQGAQHYLRSKPFVCSQATLGELIRYAMAALYHGNYVKSDNSESSVEIDMALTLVASLPIVRDILLKHVSTDWSEVRSGYGLAQSWNTSVDAIRLSATICRGGIRRSLQDQLKEDHALQSTSHEFDHQLEEELDLELDLQHPTAFFHCKACQNRPQHSHSSLSNLMSAETALLHPCFSSKASYATYASYRRACMVGNSEPTAWQADRIGVTSEALPIFHALIKAVRLFNSNLLDVDDYFKVPASIDVMDDTGGKSPYFSCRFPACTIERYRKTAAWYDMVRLRCYFLLKVLSSLSVYRPAICMHI
jgi:hypothetical protein